MKKFSKLLAVLVALAVIICPMTSAIVANATANGGTYSIVAEDANNVVLTIGSNDGFIVYQATVTFNNDSAFQNSYSDGGYTNGLKVIDYTLVSAPEDEFNAPAISAQQNGSSLVILVSATDAATLDLYSEVQIGIRVASGSTANLTKIQAADEGTVEEDPSLLNFGAKVAADGTVTLTDNSDATTGTTHEHDTAGDPEVVTAPGCTTTGSYYATCSVCGERQGELQTSQALGHNYGAWSHVENSDPPQHSRTCSRCDAVDTQNCNSSGTTPGTAATCGAPGTTDANYCTVCNFVTVASTTIPATGNHTWVAGTVTPATCVAAGNTHYTCSVCNAEKDEPIAATGVHTWGEYVSDNNATCAADGTKTRTCSVCGATDTVTDTDSHLSVAHTYGEYVSDGNATCAADGTKTRTCSVCGATDTVTDTDSHLSVAHTWGEYVSNNDATCTVDGTKTRTCSVCGATDTVTDTGSALGHDYTYTSNEDGTHDVGCTRCDFADTEDCDTAGTDGACSKCGYKASGSVLDASIVTLSPDIQIAETINIIFRASKATTTNNASYAHTNMVITAQRYDASGNIYTADPVVAEFYSLTSKNNGAAYYDVPLQSLDLTLTAYVACYNELGVEVAHSVDVVCTPVEKLKSLYTASPSTELQISTNKFVTDALNLGTAAQIYFGNQISGSCDLKSATYMNSGWDQTYATGSLTELTDVSNFVWNPDSAITSSTNNVTTAADLNGAPVIMFSIMKAASTGANPLDFSKLTMTVSYNTLAANDGNAGTITDTITGSAWNQYVVGKNLRYTFKKSAMYDSDKAVTAVITYDGVEVCTATYSLDSYVYTYRDNSSVGPILTAIARFTSAARNYFSVKLNKTV